MKFHLKSDFKPTGDQPRAIKQLTENLKHDAKHQVLLGVTGSGKSVVYNTEILIKDQQNQITKVTIGKYIDILFTQNSINVEIVNGSEILNTNKLSNNKMPQSYSFDPVTQQTSWKMITQFSRHACPKHLFKIKTEGGKEIQVTGDHNFYVLRNGTIRLINTTDIKATDYLPSPDILPEPKKNLKVLQLDSLLASEMLYLDLPNFKNVLKKNQNEIYNVIAYQKRYHMLHEKERLSLHLFSTIASFESVREKATIGTKHKKISLPLDLPITTNLMRLFGYYIAEGHSTNNYSILSSNDSEVIADFTQTINTLGISFNKRKSTYDYQINSRLLRLLFSTECGTHSVNKKLPTFWPQLSNKDLGELLKAYFSGDGGVDGQSITTTTASKQLAADLVYALLRFGIQATIRKKYVKLAHWKEKKLYWVIAISGQKDLHIFKKFIGFVIEIKVKKLDKITSVTYNTNKDLLPVAGSQLKILRLKLSLSQQDIAKAVAIERSYVSMIESNSRKPSRTVFKKYIYFLIKIAIQKNQTSLLPQLDKYKNLLNVFWVKVKSVKVCEREKYVYDLAVKENETFLAGFGGLFVHNTFTMANTIRNIQKPTLIISHNKTLAGQLYQEFRDFFPDNAVSYFVSYYDYYQPEAYVPQTDTYIEKESEINEEIDRLRLAATTNLLTRKDVIVVASVSCIYNLGFPVEYGKFVLELKRGVKISQKDILVRLTDLQYDRNDYEFRRGTFRVRGSNIDLFPAYIDYGIRIEVDQTVTNMYEFDPLTGEKMQDIDATVIYPAKHYMTDPRGYHDAFEAINHDLEAQVKKFRSENKLLEAQRLAQRTNYDLEMIREVGYVNGIENYSIYFDKRPPGSPPYTLIDYFDAASDDWLLIVDESHITLPQLRGMYNGDQARKRTLIDFGFRLPSALDNRPLKFEEFMRKTNDVIYVSATPNDYEISLAKESTKHKAMPNETPTSDTLDTFDTPDTSNNIVEQLIRPTGLIDPEIEVKPSAGQIDDLMNEIKQRVEKKQRVLITTLTKRMAEELTSYLQEHEIKVEYLHSDIETLNRQDVLDSLRLGEVDVVVGINLLREGLDLPEVSLVAILDADKEGFLRSRTSLIQTMGRAARNVDAKVIMYADRMTDSMKAAIDEGERRRKIQIEYNKKHGITPQTIQKAIRSKLVDKLPEEEKPQLEGIMQFAKKDVLLPDEREKALKLLRKEMKTAAERLDFETAIAIRDQIKRVQNK